MYHVGKDRQSRLAAGLSDGVNHSLALQDGDGFLRDAFAEWLGLSMRKSLCSNSLLRASATGCGLVNRQAIKSFGQLAIVGPGQIQPAAKSASSSP